MIIVTNVIQIS